MLVEANLPVGRGSDQIFTGMGTCWAFNCKQSRGKGLRPTNNMAPAPTTDLPEVGPDAGHEGEFIIAVLREGYQWNM